MLASGGSAAGVATWPHCGNFEETSIESASAQTSGFRDMRTLLAASGDANADFLAETETCLPHHIRRGGRPINPVPNGRSPFSAASYEHRDCLTGRPVWRTQFVSFAS